MGTVMDTEVVTHKIKITKAVFSFLKQDIVFSASMVLAAISCFFGLPKLSYIDFRVLACLFNIMLAVKAFEELSLLDRLSVGIINRCSGSRSVSLVLILMSFFASMVFTNDVALLSIVPVALIIGKKTGIDMMQTIIFQTLAANIGSSLTPMGNPQNLFIYSFYNLSAGQFFSVICFFAAAGLVWLIFLNRRSSNTKLELSLKNISLSDKKTAVIWGAVFIVIVLSVFRVVHYGIATAVVVACVALLNRKLLLKVDYRLLLTFICFFIFIGNLSNIPSVSSFMKGLIGSGRATYFGSIILSQIISNVPCAILLSGFTENWRELLLGVNVGGMGTIIASMASVISYKLYIGENPQGAGKFMARFSLYNFVGLIIFTVFNYILFVH
jgi:Na+/H+ antiporter NhaD/arsenite permease-like protein